MFQRLRDAEGTGQIVKVAVVGSGFVGQGLLHQLFLTPGMTPALVINRTPGRGVAALVKAGALESKIVISDEQAVIASAIEAGRSVVSATSRVLRDPGPIDVVVEATGDVEYGARVAVETIAGRKHLVSLNYETDATVGPLLSQLAHRRGVVYTGSDGDQPGVMMRLIEYVRGIGLDVVAAINCKGFLDVHATPETIKPWAEKQGTSLKMTTAFTDGTKMNVENCCVSNAAGLIPEKRGMNGVKTTLADAIEDFGSTLGREGVVDYTLGGDFGSGVLVLGSGAHSELAAPYLEYLKMGPGPWYPFFRPWHLVQFETPLSIADAALDGQPTIAPAGQPISQVVAIAKRDLERGREPDGIGGFDCYGEIDRMEASRDLLPVGLADHCRLTRDVARDTPISLSDVELDEQSPIVRMSRLQEELFDSGNQVGVGIETVVRLWDDS